MSEFLLDHSSQGLRLAKRDNQRVTHWDFQLNDLSSQHVGGIYRGRVVEVLKGGQMAFVDIGLNAPGVLPLKERKFQTLKRGEDVLCQISREPDPSENKGPHLSRNITLALGPVLYTPFTPGFRFSQKINNPEFAGGLKNDIREEEGVILRHWAGQYDAETLSHILQKLRKEWESILTKIVGKPPQLLKPAPTLLERIVTQSQPGDSLVTNHKPSASKLEKLFLEAYNGGPEILATRDSPFDDNIEDQWDSLTQSHIPIPCGGELVIEETTALVAVDVNNGGGNSTPHDLNRQALKELFHQIQLRNLAGIIIVDLAGNIKHPKQLLQSARALADSDTHIHGLTDLGLLEISRKKTGSSLMRMLKNQRG